MKMKRIVMVAFTLLFAGVVQSAELCVNFDSNVVQQASSPRDIGADKWQQVRGDSEVHIVNSGPLTGSEDASMRLYDNHPSKSPTIWYHTGETMKVGKLSLDFHVVDFGNNYFTMHIDEARTDASALTISVIGNVLNYSTSSGSTVAFEQTVGLDADYTLEIDFDFERNQFSGTLNGVPLSRYNGKQTDFPVQKEDSDIKRLTLNAGWSKGLADVYVDNIELVSVLGVSQ